MTDGMSLSEDSSLKGDRRWVALAMLVVGGILTTWGLFAHWLRVENVRSYVLEWGLSASIAECCWLIMALLSAFLTFAMLMGQRRSDLPRAVPFVTAIAALTGLLSAGWTLRLAHHITLEDGFWSSRHAIGVIVYFADDSAEVHYKVTFALVGMSLGFAISAVAAARLWWIARVAAKETAVELAVVDAALAAKAGDLTPPEETVEPP